MRELRSAAGDSHGGLCGRPEEQDTADRVAPSVPCGIESNLTNRAEPSRAEPNQTGLCRAEPLNHSNGDGFTELSCNLLQYSKGDISCPIKKTSFLLKIV